MGRAYADEMNRNKHDRLRIEPRTRRRFLLREAVKSTGAKIIDFEWLANPESFGQRDVPLVWYDVAIEHKGRICVVFLYDDHVSGALAHVYKPLNVKARQRKIEYAKANSIPFCEVRATSQMRMQMQIELWLMTTNKEPYRLAPPPGKWTEPDGERDSKTGTHRKDLG